MKAIRTTSRRRILICDRHPLIRRGLASIIADTSDLCICAEAVNSQDALTQMVSSQPDLAVVDFDPQGQGKPWLTTEHQAALRKTPFLVLTAYPSQRAERSGHARAARRFLAKSAAVYTLLQAMRQLLGDETPAQEVPERNDR